MKKSVIIGGVAVILLIILIAVPVSSYNSIVTSREDVNTKAATIDVQLKRRADLIGNLLETVKGYAAHEKEIIDSVTEAREKLIGAKTTTEKAEANDAATSAISGLLAISESYPDIKADANFRQFADELAGTENRISVARIDYNNAVSSYNKKIITFPGSLLAGAMGFTRAEYFEAAESEKEAPEVKF